MNEFYQLVLATDIDVSIADNFPVLLVSRTRDGGENSILFTDQRYLYLLTSPLDDEGVSATSYVAPGYEDMFAVEETPATLYRMNLDGTDGKKVLEF